MIYQLIYSPITGLANKKIQLDHLFGEIWANACIRNPDFELKNFRSFLPKTSTNFEDLLGEWVRLWNSYLPGLFAYYKFPKWISTNVQEERAFGQEKTKIIKRLSKKKCRVFLANTWKIVFAFSLCRNRRN